MSKYLQRAFSATVLFIALPSQAGFAQEAQKQTSGSGDGLSFTVTANRSPTALQRTGSAISVVTADDLAKTNPSTLVDALRAVPGVEVTDSGGPGAPAFARVRGANSGQTLVLVDGVPVNDPSGPSGEFDLSIIAPGLIDRIEVLRGPQSALYGSDAIGGVISILTKQGKGAPTTTVGAEGGSYGSVNTHASTYGGIGPWNYAASGTAARSDGFSSYGYHIGRLEAKNRGRFEMDGFSRLGGFGRIGYDAGQGVRANLSVMGTNTVNDYDAYNGDSPSAARKQFAQVNGVFEFDSFDNVLTHRIQTYFNRADRHSRDVGKGRSYFSFYDYVGDRYGAEYQGTLKLGSFGTLMGGGRILRETAIGHSEFVAPFPMKRTKDFDFGQNTASAFGLWQWPVTERLTMSVGGRYDKITDGDSFGTWRSTVAYRILETGTKLRASAGTGAKAPTLYQRLSPEYGNPLLRSEESFGFDGGVDQDILNGRATVSVTGFSNRLRNLINFQLDPSCGELQYFGCYVNVARARTSGVEVAAKATIIEEWLSVSGNYTYLDATDQKTHKTLARRAPSSGKGALQITPNSQWLFEPSVTFMSKRYSGPNETQRLGGYARYDLYAEYRPTGTWKIHARIENLTNKKYQNIYNYGTSGRAYYAGLNATW